MIPFYFGPAERKLFGIYHAPPTGTEVRSGLVICGPFGHEAIRIHRLFRVLAERLARNGVAVLRFDYFGCGESGGDDQQGEMKGWRLDLLRAHEELARRSGAPRVGWLGARLGAALVLQSARHAQGLDRLLLWDPVLDGPAYLEELERAHLATLERAFYSSRPSWYEPRPEGQEISEALGHAFGRELISQLRALRGDGLQLPPGSVAATLLATAQDSKARDWSTREQGRGASLDFELLDHPIIWTSDPLPNQAIVPAQVISRLAAAFQ